MDDLLRLVKVLPPTGEANALFGDKAETKFGGQPWYNVRFVSNDGNIQYLPRNNNRETDESTFGEDQIRLELSEFSISYGDAIHRFEDVGEVVPIKIATPFTGWDVMKWYA